jgi:uncharacterized membrane protein YphA (DoxX/SURF4 family)
MNWVFGTFISNALLGITVRQNFEEMLPRAGLGSVMLAAGVSKFVIPSYWSGYEPQLLIEILPATARQLMLIGGVLELSLGTLLISGRKTCETALLTAAWLSAITLQLASMEFWALAIRDTGLVFYALTVYMLERAEDSPP